MSTASRHHNISRHAVQMILALALAIAVASPALAKKHAAHPPTPPTQTESALKAAEAKEWDEAELHARKSGDTVLVKLVTWMYLQDADARAPFAAITAFIRANPDWPQQARLHLRAEQSLRYSEVPDAVLGKWLEANPPVSGTGKIALAELMMRRGASLSDGKVQFLIRDAWRNGDFEEAEEERLLGAYKDVLRSQDHISRVDYLLWEDHMQAAQRVLDLLPEDQRQLMRARLALEEDAGDVDFYIAHVPRALLSDPGLILARAQWRANKGDTEGARDLLLSAPVPVPYPQKWWKLRDSLIREAIGRRDYKMARKLLANHGQTGGPEYADALWLSGWLSLEFLQDPQDAYLQFYHMFDAVKHAMSKSRAAYWAGRAAEGAGDAEAARGWYVTAASYPTTFYGQLAYAALYEGQPLRLPVEPVISKEERAQFKKSDMVHAIGLAARAHASDLATALLHHMIDEAPDSTQASLAASVGDEIKSALLSVRGAKRANQRGIMLVKTGYPTLKISSTLDIEPALALAITRQESEFDPNAKSKSGALGMMQLLPRTAKEIARKTGVRYSESRLREPAYNMQLASNYLLRLIKGYDGSYVMAVAAYNAGPGNVRGWISDFGSPHSGLEGAIDWIEMIPFIETRNYVQRVIENLEIYRHLLSKGGHRPPLSIEEDLKRAS